ncbi:unnamed protein product [Didymodactylos carnosus]|uniref:Uncharacterized protein n=1 Tax=Didymodactylos carnosus TaxID=1234261 RepID=A0A815YJ88_9BILA|nr:unnamed protein product [Didymodactylos carnosus]CAF1571249.1 unnamed protein product [Didymodactylos carnosus]CAF4060704.1 unnamed protein product [Didymodactylos carnosus]CAF4434740.1 unnamed protein product [Didymodactylos carnosus]
MMNYSGFALSTVHRRRNYARSILPYVAPVTVELGTNAMGSQLTCQYIPVREMLKVYLENPAMKAHLNDLRESADGIIRDFTDGFVYQNHTFFSSNGLSIVVMLYQDRFELTNPCNSMNKKRKMVGFYLNLGNVPNQFRSLVQPIKLVLLIEEKVLKYFWTC